MISDQVAEWLETAALPTSQARAAEALGMSLAQLHVALVEERVRWMRLLDLERIRRLVESGPIGYEDAANVVGFFGSYLKYRFKVWHNRVSWQYPEQAKHIVIHHQRRT